MTNAEKYKEIFGFEPDTTSCPTEECGNCPLRHCTKMSEETGIKTSLLIKAWWSGEYKE